MKPWAKQAGFTIVELLIVVVVIAILATITIVAYNNTQQRAKNASALSYATTLSKKAQAYQTVNGNYPTTCSQFQNTSESSLVGSGIECLNPDVNRLPSKVQYYVCDSGLSVRISYQNYSTGLADGIYLGDYASRVSCAISYGGPY